MKVLIAACLLGIIPFAYSQPTHTGSATATGECAISHSGNNDTIIIQNCGIGEEQGKTIIAILKAVLSNQNHDAQNAKLDELLTIAKQAINRYGSVTTYQPNGIRRTVTESNGTIFMDSDATTDYESLSEKEKSHDWQGLLDVAQKSIAKYPGWFTPIAFLGYAQMQLCQTNEAIETYNKFLTDSDGAILFTKMYTNAQKNLLSIKSNEYKAYCQLHHQ